VVEGRVEVEIAGTVVTIEGQIMLHPQRQALVLVSERVGSSLEDMLDWGAHSCGLWVVDEGET